MATEYEILRKTAKVIRQYAGKTGRPTRADRAGLNELGDLISGWADRIDEGRMTAPAGSTPEGEGWGKPWRPQPGVTFLAFGALTRTFIETEPGPVQGMAGIDLTGKWNHGAADTLSIICHASVAEEWGRDLQEVGIQAPLDAVEYLRRLRRET